MLLSAMVVTVPLRDLWVPAAGARSPAPSPPPPLAIRSGRDRAASRPNRALDAAVALSAVLQVAAVTVGPLRELLGTDTLSPGQLAACAAVAVVPGLLVAPYRRLRRWRKGHRGAPPSRVRASS